MLRLIDRSTPFPHTDFLTLLLRTNCIQHNIFTIHHLPRAIVGFFPLWFTCCLANGFFIFPSCVPQLVDQHIFFSWVKGPLPLRYHSNQIAIIRFEIPRFDMETHWQGNMYMQIGILAITYISGVCRAERRSRASLVGRKDFRISLWWLRWYINIVGGSNLKFTRTHKHAHARAHKQTQIHAFKHTRPSSALKNDNN